ncbi:phosphotransferase family protein, partial [Parafrankia colletiae]|uniref:phosphotransferase family protein n=1 Tax=Parafrankia colletiae TaxID=573497 RepID=UPI0018E3B761
MSALMQSEAEIEALLMARLPSWISLQLDDPRAVVSGVARLAGGYSNETWKVRCEHSAYRARKSTEFIVRWSPEGALFYPADVSGQFALLKALEPTPIPAPAPLWLEPDPAVLGEPFLTMQLVPGVSAPRVFALDDVQRDAKLTAYVQTLAGIHALDWRQFDLGSVLTAVSPESCAGVALDGVIDHVSSRGMADDAIVKRAVDWLTERVPSRSDVSLIHGDPNVSNYRFEGTSVVAVLDWDLARISDPLWDVAAYCMSMAKYFANEPRRVQESERRNFLGLYEEAS